MKTSTQGKYVIRARGLEEVAACEQSIVCGALVALLMRFHEELWIDMEMSEGTGERASYHVVKDVMFGTPILRACSESETAARFGQVALAANERALEAARVMKMAATASRFVE
jgi:hypothetical protein